jgi:hypothetical protein
MGWLVRKISKRKWEQPEGLPTSAVGADAITADLRTRGNRLSLWECNDPDDEEEMLEIAAALVTSLQRIDNIDLAWIDSDELARKGIMLQRTQGDTLIREMVDRHVDAVSLDLDCFCQVAFVFLEAIKTNLWYKRILRPTILERLRRAVQEGQLSLDGLTDKQEALRNELSS